MRYKQGILKNIDGELFDIFHCPKCGLWVRYFLFNKDKGLCHFCLEKEDE